MLKKGRGVLLHMGVLCICVCVCVCVCVYVWVWLCKNQKKMFSPKFKEALHNYIKILYSRSVGSAPSGARLVGHAAAFREEREMAQPRQKLPSRLQTSSAVQPHKGLPQQRARPCHCCRRRRGGSTSQCQRRQRRARRRLPPRQRKRGLQHRAGPRCRTSRLRRQLQCVWAGNFNVCGLETSMCVGWKL